MKNLKLYLPLAAALALSTLTAHAATCPANLGVSTTPAADFTVNADGTVTHSTTGLMWKQCNEGLSGANCATGSATYMLWGDALTAAKNSAFAGYTDWRLPNKQELESLVDDTCTAPAINDAVFPNTASEWTWTSTTWAAGPAVAWVVNFYNGYSGADVKASGDVVVRLVRGGQSFDTLAAVADTTAPDTSVTSGTVSSTATTATIAFNGTDNVAVTGYECSLDGAAFAACTSPVNLTGLSVGSHTFQVRAKDAAGNVDATPASVTWAVQAAVAEPAKPVPVGGVAWLLLLVSLLAGTAVRLRRR